MFDFIVQGKRKTSLIVNGLVGELAGDGAAAVKEGLRLYDIGPWLMLVRKIGYQVEGSYAPLDSHELLYMAW